ncbi:MAG: UMP kinase [Thermoplasmata archaeon]|jgi:uridylate kinase|nr:UMP kinase [Thermoplasmatales archaeon]PMP73900.1 MAG: UMP kinase [Aciduliprofundum sp.]HEU13061.1 UMP kinase [Euryarchaeota archaeon]
MEDVVISLGGSLVNPGGIDDSFLHRFSEMVNSLKERYRFIIVVGGGRLARDYIEMARKRGESEYFLDMIGIMATRMNAMLVKSYIKNARFSTDMRDIFSGNVVMGGTEPGHTTDAVSMLVAELLGVKSVINATTVDGIYDRDPKLNPGARLIDDISYGDLLSLFYLNSSGAGPNQVLDFLSIKIAERSRIEIRVINGRDIDNFISAIEGKHFRGTRVHGQ